MVEKNSSKGLTQPVSKLEWGGTFDATEILVIQYFFLPFFVCLSYLYTELTW